MRELTGEASIAILAGGESRRMGRDKAALVYRGIPLLERIAAEASEAASDVLVIGRDRPGDWPLEQVRFVVDDLPGRGPLGGLCTALRRAKSPRVLLLACDMPEVTSGTLRWILEQDRQLGTDDGMMVENNGQMEPLCSVYAVSLLPVVEQRLTGERRSLRGLIAEGRFGTVTAPPEIAQAMRNVNTPDEYQSFCQGDGATDMKP